MQKKNAILKCNNNIWFFYNEEQRRVMPGKLPEILNSLILEGWKLEKQPNFNNKGSYILLKK